MPDPDRRRGGDALARLLRDPELRERLGSAGIETAAGLAWSRRIDALEAFFIEVATSRRIAPSPRAAPELPSGAR